LKSASSSSASSSSKAHRDILQKRSCIRETPDWDPS
jgi:hypothetical protein